MAGAGAGGRCDDYLRCRRLCRGGRGECAAAGLRVPLDTGNEKIDYKVREHSLAKIPLMLVVGRREAENRAVSLRRLGSNEQQYLRSTRLLLD